jgi:hypothetical protein
LFDAGDPIGASMRYAGSSFEAPLTQYFQQHFGALHFRRGKAFSETIVHRGEHRARLRFSVPVTQQVREAYRRRKRNDPISGDQVSHMPRGRGPTNQTPDNQG